MTAEQFRIRARREAAKLRELLDCAKSELEGEGFDPKVFGGELLKVVNEP